MERSAAIIAELEAARLAKYPSVEARSRALKSIRNALDYAYRVEARARGTHTDEEWIALVGKYNFRCLRCGFQHDPDNMPSRTLIVPAGDGGSESIDNIQPLCRSCRAGRHADATNWREYRDAVGWAQHSDGRSLPPMIGPPTVKDLAEDEWARVVQRLTDERSSSTDER